MPSLPESREMLEHLERWRIPPELPEILERKNRGKCWIQILYCVQFNFMQVNFVCCMSGKKYCICCNLIICDLILCNYSIRANSRRKNAKLNFCNIMKISNKIFVLLPFIAFCRLCFKSIFCTFIDLPRKLSKIGGYVYIWRSAGEAR